MSKTEIAIDVNSNSVSGLFIQNGRAVNVKVPRNHGDSNLNAFSLCLSKGAEALQSSLYAVMKNTQVVRYSNNYAREIIASKSGPRVGLIVTKGYGKSLYSKPKIKTVQGLFVQDTLIAEIDEQIDPTGKVITSPGQEDIVKIAKYLMERGAQTIAICLKNAYFNPENEIKIKNYIENEISKYYLGAVGTLCSNQVSILQDDYVRLNTTVVSLLVLRNLSRMLRKTDSDLRDSGLISSPKMFVSAIGGIRRASKARALDALWSSSVSGMLGCSYLGKINRNQNIISVDIGITETTVGIIEKGSIKYNLRPTIEGLPIDLPVPEFKSIFVGDFSSCYVDEEGNIQIGPEYSDNGPACFGQNGTATVLDAALVLGRIPEHYRGRDLDLDKAKKAISHLAEKKNIKLENAASMIIDTVYSKIGSSISDYLKSRNIAANTYDLYLYGDAASNHACGIAPYIMAKETRVFPFENISALGQLNSSYLYWQSIPFNAPFCTAEGKLCFSDLDKLNRIVDDMMDIALRDLKGEKIPNDEKNIKKIFFILGDKIGPEKLFEAGSKLDPKALKEICEELNKDNTSRSKTFDLIAVGLSMAIEAGERSLPNLKTLSDSTSALKEKKNVFWTNGYMETSIYDLTQVNEGSSIKGPAILESSDVAFSLPDGYQVKFTANLNCTIEQC